jgi:hypothetical protein
MELYIFLLHNNDGNFVNRTVNSEIKIEAEEKKKEAKTGIGTTKEIVSR